MFYKNGEVFLLTIFKDQNSIKIINKLLLMGYYLVNIGYSLAVISFWKKVDSVTTMIESLSFVIGSIIIFLAILHYNNMIILKQISKRKLLNK